MKRAALQFYRLAVLVAIAWIIRAHTVRMRIEGHAPITVEEARSVFPQADALRPDAGERAGMFVDDPSGQELGYILRTSPITDSIIGYRGWTDTLVAFDPALRVVGVRIRSSQDTREHVQDVRDDRYFMKTWNGKSWDEVARRTPEDLRIEGVSGATMTSMAMAEGIMRRLRAADAALTIKPTPFRFSAVDAGLVLIIATGLTLAFTGTYGRRWLRIGFQLLVIGYVGFFAGVPLAQSLFAGWAQYAAPWRSAPGLVLLMAAALAVPWATRKPVYCQQLCPHGAAQELLGRFAPKRWRVALPKDFAAGLRWLPGLLLGFVIVITILSLPIDLAHIEPFDAYSLRAAGIATIVIAIVGLLASLFVPMAYCHYGCPTGALLEFIRTHGRTDHFGRRDVAALLLVAFAWVLSWKYHAIHAWMVADV
ncbi:MAG: 4Fe-4S binding protein [Verrucomicrobiota bacterium]|nr:4Fe-4S binding protein [Verrucomicrobiota bacterium]